MELMHANREWATRPADERFLSLTDLHNRVTRTHQLSKQGVVSTKDLSLIADQSGENLMIVGKAGKPMHLSNYATKAIAIQAGAPVSYITTLPASIAGDALTYGLRNSEKEERAIMYQSMGDDLPGVVKAFTGTGYTRVWNDTITHALIQRFGDGVTGDWKVPGEFGKDVPITKDNTTIYGSDRDMFVFLCDEKHRIEMPGRRTIKDVTTQGNFARGFFVWNSEVGDNTLGIATFLFDYVCSNRIVWGAENIKFKHTKNVSEKWLDEATPMLNEYANSKASEVESVLINAKAKKVEDVAKFLSGRSPLFSDKAIEKIKAVHLLEEQRPIETIWDTVTAITAYAKSIPNNNDRVKWETLGGKVLDLVANK